MIYHFSYLTVAGKCQLITLMPLGFFKCSLRSYLVFLSFFYLKSTSVEVIEIQCSYLSALMEFYLFIYQTD